MALWDKSFCLSRAPARRTKAHHPAKVNGLSSRLGRPYMDWTSSRRGWGGAICRLFSSNGPVDLIDVSRSIP